MSPSSRRPIWQLTLLAVAVMLFLGVVRQSFNHSPALPVGYDDDSEHDCVMNSSISTQLLLTGPVSYGRLRIDVSESSGQTESSRNLGITMPTLHRFGPSNDTSFAAGEKGCSARTTVIVPRGSKETGDASHIVFGLATTLDRLEESLQAIAHWAGNTGTTVFCLASGQSLSAGRMARIIRDASDLGINLDIARSNSSGPTTEGDRYFALTKHVHERRLRDPPNWAAFIDDDTFFPSMAALVERLDAYNASLPQYVGGLAEDLGHMRNFGFMAYGGGGIFLSTPLLGQIYEHFDRCDANRVEGGDKRIADCIYAWTTTKLSWEPGLHQTDLHGDASGFYEADRAQPLSIHHWKSWNEVDVVGLSAVSDICGAVCLLQKYRFSDGWLLTNGYSIVKYSVESPSDTAMEKTWVDAGDYAHTLAPLRAKDDGKISFRLEASVSESGRVRQYYVRRQRSGDSVVEVEWRRRS